MNTNSIISIQELLKGRGRNKEFDQADPKRIKFFNHSTEVRIDCIISNDYEGWPIYKLYQEQPAKFLEWQSEQQPITMKDTDFIVVFIAEGHYESRFIGVFKNCGPSHPTTHGFFYYDLKEVSGFEILKERVVIDWGKAQGFYQWWHKTKEVIRIEQKSRTDGIPLFTRYEDVKLSYKQLKTVVKDKEWQSKLNCQNCVYVILDKKNGKQYVGVTYKDVNSSKKNGILSRWTEYADSGHGNNKKLVELLKKEGISYAEKNFQWSILETLSLNVTQKVATDREKLYKEKLGTREHGYNEN